MENIVLSIPSKTFIAGEYLALKGGPALVANTGPGFKFHFRKLADEEKSIENPFPTSSPAALFWQENSELFSRVERTAQIEFLGAGSSTADFLSLYVYLLLHQGKEFSLCRRELPALTELLDCYRKHSKLQDDKGNLLAFQPSGLDLLAQMTGRLSWLDARAQVVAIKMEWPFPDLGFFLLRTDTKVPTHLHLAELTSFSQEGWEGLSKEMRKVSQSFLDKNQSEFLLALEGFADQLRALKLEAAKTHELVKTFASLPGVLAKGCGALGADMIAVFFPKDLEKQVRNLVPSSCVVAASNGDLSEGMMVTKL